MAPLDRLLEPISHASRVASQIPTEVIHEATMAESTTRLLADAAAAGLAREARPLEREAAEAASDARRFEAVERPLVQQGTDLRTIADAIAVGKPRPPRRLWDV